MYVRYEELHQRKKAEAAADAENEAKSQQESASNQEMLKQAALAGGG